MGIHSHIALVFSLSTDSNHQKSEAQAATTKGKAKKNVKQTAGGTGTSEVKESNCYLVFFTQKALQGDAQQYFASPRTQPKTSSLHNCLFIQRALFSQLFTRSLWVDIPADLKRQEKLERKFKRR